MTTTITPSGVRWPGNQRRPALFRLVFDFGDQALPQAFKTEMWAALAQCQVQPPVEFARQRPAYASRHHQSPVATLTTLSADSLDWEAAGELAQLGRAVLAELEMAWR